MIPFFKSPFRNGIYRFVLLLVLCPKFVGATDGERSTRPAFRPGKDYALLFAVDDYRDKKWQGGKQQFKNPTFARSHITIYS